MATELQGKIHHIGSTQTFGQSFKKRPFILLVPNPRDSKYDDFIPMSCVRDRVDMLDQYREGDSVCVSVDIKGRLSKDDDRKAYADLECWKIVRPGGGNREPERERQPQQREERREPDRGQSQSRARTYQPPALEGEDEIPF